MQDLFKRVETVLVIDWPSRDVPEALARAGLQVVVHGGPGPEDYSVHELSNGRIVERKVGRPPERADLVYSYRPFSELLEIIATAKALGATAIWAQSGLSGAGVKDPKGCWVAEEELRVARDPVQSAGLDFITQPYIADAAREIPAVR